MGKIQARCSEIERAVMERIENLERFGIHNIKKRRGDYILMYYHRISGFVSLRGEVIVGGELFYDDDFIIPFFCEIIEDSDKVRWEDIRGDLKYKFVKQ